MKKRQIFIFLSLITVVCLSLTACFSNDNDKNAVLDNEGVQTETFVSVGEAFDFGVPVRDGYNFVAWYDSKTGGSALTDKFGQSLNPWNFNKKKIVYARWTPNDYIIKLDYQGATAENTKNTIKATYDSEVVTLPVPVKLGSDFDGWYTAASGGARASTADGIPVAEYKIYKTPQYTTELEEEKATVLYARWTAADMTINFETSGGTAVDAQTNKSGSVLESMPLTAQNNKTFVGWYEDATFSKAVEFPFTVPHNNAKTITLYAKFFDATTNILSFNAINSDKEYRVVLADESFSGAVIVPDMYFDKKITAIGSFENGAMTSVILPHSATVIVSKAFMGCHELESIKLPQNIKEIPEQLFVECVKLSEVKIPASVTKIGDYGFAACGITSIEIPEKVSTMGSSPFIESLYLAKITVAEGNKSFFAEDNVLYRNYSSYYHLIAYAPSKQESTYTILAKTKTVLDYAFGGAENLKYISVGGSITKIGEGAFADCTGLIRVEIDLDLDATGETATIGNRAFDYCINLKAVIVKGVRPCTLGGTGVFDNVSDEFAIYVPTDSVSRYESFARWSAFKGNIFGLNAIFGDFAVMEYSTGYAIRQYLGVEENVVIPEIINGKQILSISQKAFARNDALKAITIPQYVILIDDEAFAYCTALESVTINNTTPPTLNSTAFWETNYTFYIYVDTDPKVVNAYRTAINWSIFSTRIFSKSN